MADWLTHVLLAYAIFTLLGWGVEWLDGRWIAVGILGSLLPDLNRIQLLLSSETVSTTLGIAIDWEGIHTLAGMVLLSLVGALLFEARRDQRRALLALLSGALFHLLVDVPQSYADGYTLTNLYLYPLPPWRFPTPGLYVSTDRWVAVVALVVAVAVYALDRLRTYRRKSEDVN